MERSDLLNKIQDIIEKSNIGFINKLDFEEISEISEEITEGVIDLLYQNAGTVEGLFNSDGSSSDIIVVNITDLVD